MYIGENFCDLCSKPIDTSMEKDGCGNIIIEKGNMRAHCLLHITVCLVCRAEYVKYFEDKLPVAAEKSKKEMKKIVEEEY